MNYDYPDQITQQIYNIKRHLEILITHLKKKLIIGKKNAKNI